jgi:hypothetical protein
MSRQGQPRDYFEPWTATKSERHGSRPFPDGKPAQMLDEAYDQVVSSWERTERDADWIIWGSRMTEPAICVNLTGSITVTGDRRIITVAKALGLPAGSPDHESIAKRICACVNACRDIADPLAFVEEARALLVALVNREVPRDDTRLLRLLAMCVPPEEWDCLPMRSNE